MNIIIKIFIIFILINTNAYSKNIKKITIEGMALGDSALNFFSESEIKKEIITDWNNKKYETSEIKSKNFKKFDIVHISYLSADNNFKIAAIQGLVSSNYSKCLNQIEKISKKLKEKFPKAQIQPPYEYKNNWDKTGKSKITDIIITFGTGKKIEVLDTVTLYCYQYSEEYKKNNQILEDDLVLKISSKEFDLFLFSEAYN